MESTVAHSKFNEFVASCANWKNAKLFYSCIARPLLVKEDGHHLDTPILLLSPPPSLHLKLSLNSVLTDLKKVWPDLSAFLKSKHIPTEVYHGGADQKIVLEGNQVL